MLKWKRHKQKCITTILKLFHSFPVSRLDNFSSKLVLLELSRLPTVFLRTALDTSIKKPPLWFWANFNTETSKMGSPKGERIHKVSKSNLLKRCRQFPKWLSKSQLFFSVLFHLHALSIYKTSIILYLTVKHFESNSHYISPLVKRNTEIPVEWFKQVFYLSIV